MKTIRRSHFEAWVKKMTASGLAPGTVKTRFNNVRAVFRAAHRDKILHDLRDFYASGLIAQGCDVVNVQRALGHAYATTTLNTYSKFHRRGPHPQSV